MFGKINNLAEKHRILCNYLRERDKTGDVEKERKPMTIKKKKYTE